MPLEPRCEGDELSQMIHWRERGTTEHRLGCYGRCSEVLQGQQGAGMFMG